MATSTHLFGKGWPLIYLYREGWPLILFCLPICLFIYLGEMATHLSIQEEMATSTHLFEEGLPPLSLYSNGDANLYTYFGAVYLLIYRPTCLEGDGHPLPI